MKLSEALYIIDQKERKKVNEWENKIDGLKEYIDSEFPDGCKEYYKKSCKSCPLQLCEKGTKWYYLCELLEDWSRRNTKNSEWK